MAYEHLQIAQDGAIATITINRPAVLNALSRATLDELDTVLAEVRDDARVRAVVVTGSGTKAFVAGADIRELAEQTPVTGRSYAQRGQRVFDAIEQLGKPVVAAINGYALGGGLELAMACTFRVVADTAKLGLPEVTLGLIPGYAGTQRLLRLVGRGRALDMILTGRQVDADEALAMGLVTKVVAFSSVLEEAQTLAADLATRAPVALRYAMDAILHGGSLPFAEACAYEATLFGLVASTDDMKEGTRAFLEKRPPRFEGR
ncbi:MAG: enoyl-CoA hydratase [Luteitalea sp.]|nr:enoyl-CoA hydratase [Luteitalea sp.]